VLGAQRFLATAKAPGNEEPVLPNVAGMMATFEAHMQNDFNTSGALGALSKPLAEANGLLATGKGVGKATRYLSLARFVADMKIVADILGCFGQEPEVWLRQRRDQKAMRLGLDMAKVAALVVDRVKVRAARDWEAADQIRTELTALGVSVQDGPEGSEWDFI